MLNALSSTLKSESDDQSRNAAPTIPSAAELCWIARTALEDRVERRARERSLQLTDEERAGSASFVVPSSASARKSSGTNESSAKYAIIAARCVPRSAKNFRRIDRHGRAVCSAPWMPLRRLPISTEISSQVAQVAILDRDGSILATTARDPGRPSGSSRPRTSCSSEADRLALARGLPELSPARGLDPRRQRLRRPARRPADRRDDALRPDGRPDLLRPQALPRQHRRCARRAAGTRPAAQARPRRAGRRTALRRSLDTPRARSSARWSASVLYRRRSAKRIERVELYAGDGSMVSLADGSIEAEELLGARPRRALGSGLMSRARRLDPRSRAPRRRLPAPLGQAQQLLPRQVPLLDPARPARRARRSDRRRRARARARRRPARRARSSAPCRSPPPPRSRPGCRS